MKRTGSIVAAGLLAAASAWPTMGCRGPQPQSAGDGAANGDAAAGGTRTAPSGVSVPPGYDLEAIVTGLDFPSAVAMSDGRMWVAETGVRGAPRVREVVQRRSVSTLSGDQLPAGTLMAPLTDVTYQEGWLWLTHAQRGARGEKVGAVSKLRPDDPVRTFTTVLTNLPSTGDHHTEAIAFDEDGRAYFSQGTATNTGVVGPDNHLVTGWLRGAPQFHDHPAVDIQLSGTEYRSPDPRSPGQVAITAPFRPFGSGRVGPNAIIPGASPGSPQDGYVAGNGTVYSFDPRAPLQTMRLEAWGLRDPKGIGIDPMRRGRLYIANAGAEVRVAMGPTARGSQGEQASMPEGEQAASPEGEQAPMPRDEQASMPEGEQTEAPRAERRVIGLRPIAQDHDDLFLVDIGRQQPQFYGFPDFFHDPRSGAVLPVSNALFCDAPAVRIPCPDFVLSPQTRRSLQVQPAVAELELGAGAGKLDFARHADFGGRGEVFLALAGSAVSQKQGTVFAGYRVVRIDRESGQIRDFIVNRGDTAQELLRPVKLVKPVDVGFRGRAMYIVDIGVYEPRLGLLQGGTGKIWRVTRRR